MSNRWKRTPAGTGGRAQWKWARSRLAETFLPWLALSTVLLSCGGANRAPISGSVYDVKGNPLAGVVVTVTRSEHSRSGQHECVKVTDATGAFSCTSLDGERLKPKKTYTIVLEKGGFSKASIERPYERNGVSVYPLLQEPWQTGPVQVREAPPIPEPMDNGRLEETLSQ